MGKDSLSCSEGPTAFTAETAATEAILKTPSRNTIRTLTHRTFCCAGFLVDEVRESSASRGMSRRGRQMANKTKSPADEQSGQDEFCSAVGADSAGQASAYGLFRH